MNDAIPDIRRVGWSGGQAIETRLGGKGKDFSIDVTRKAPRTFLWKAGHTMTQTNLNRPGLALAATALAMMMVLTTTTHAVTYQATGMFDDGTTWTAEAMFPEIAMADMLVTIDEMSSFIATTQAMAPFLAATYDKSEGMGNSFNGLVFDGTTAGSNVTGPAASTLEFYSGFNNINFQELVMAGLIMEEETNSAVGSVREGTFEVVWTHSPPVVTGAIPEPATSGMVAMGLASLVLSHRRRRSA